MQKFRIVLAKFENSCREKPGPLASGRKALMEFHIRREVREKFCLEGSLFSLTGNVVLADMRQVRDLTQKFNEGLSPGESADRYVRASQLNAMGLIDEVLHYIVALYREQVQPDIFETGIKRLEQNLGRGKTGVLFEDFCGRFPPRDVYSGTESVNSYLEGREDNESHKSLSLEELLLLAMANLNPAFRRFNFLFDDSALAKETVYPGAIDELKAHLAGLPVFGPEGMNLWDLLRAPALASPDSLLGQLEYMKKRWGLLLGRYMGRLLTGLDIIKEEEKPSFFGPGPSLIPDYRGFENEYERFTPDQDWMPRTVLMAKSILVWLFQLSQKYGRELRRLDEVPDEELDELARRGFTGLWLIGVWERSKASKTIKQWTGNPEAAASAYSLYDYDIAEELGGWGALANLRERCIRRGIRIGSDMVPNHTGIDSRWVIEYPDRFLQLPYPPFPGYKYNCENLSGRGDVTVQIEDHYFSRSDAAVVFKRINNNTGEVRYIYHGNDGTSMPWNDTAQIDFLNGEAREAVIRTIVGVCQQFPIVRFDAAMTLAKRHIQRLWYPAPGQGGDIASRAEHAISTEEFNRRIPEEFWREVVDRCAAEAPYTLLLAEAFWMMEGYFVRTLGMHRVYNSAFMNMLKNEENEKYRTTIKNTLEFDPEILKRFVNFMNNPDEDTAVAQFGKGDKYFGICTLLVTMPGLPMFGHGQIEGFEEKYGMEYRRSYKDETPDRHLVDRHEREIFPLMKKRHIFSGSENFCLYDFLGAAPGANGAGGRVNENVFAYSNSTGEEKSLVFYNNSYSSSSGWVQRGSVPIPQKDGKYKQDTLCEALGLHGEDRFFMVFLEQRSNLWFIRSSREISERGLFAALNGYEAQVFMDIQEREDAPGAKPGTWKGRWAMLNHELNGKGVHNLEEAMLNIALSELYSPIKEILSLFNSSFLIPHSSFLIPNSSLPHSSLPSTDIFKAPVDAFVAAVEKYLDGANGRYPKPDKKKPRINRSKIEKAVKGWFLFLENLLAAENQNTTPPGSANPALLALGYNILTLLRAFSDDGHGAAAGTAPDDALSAAPDDTPDATPGAAALASHWHLDKFLTKCWEEAGIPHETAKRGAGIALALLSRINSESAAINYKTAKTPGAIAAALVLENYDSEDFRKILGVNRFNDVTWFNKEAFDETLVLVPFILSLESMHAIGKNPETPKEREKRIETIAAVAETFRLAEEASGYRLDELPGLLSEK